MSKFYVNKGGSKIWVNDLGEHHREDGPAIEYYNGNKYWCQNDLYHRIDGPAIELTNGSKAWYYYGKHIRCSSQQEFERWLRLKVFI